MLERETTRARPVGVLNSGVLAPAARSTAWLARFARTKPLGAVGGVITTLLILIAVFAPQIAPDGPKEALERENVHLSPRIAFPMGTDHIGRDVLTRVIHGARISLYIGFGRVIIGMTLGSVLALTPVSI